MPTRAAGMDSDVPEDLSEELAGTVDHLRCVHRRIGSGHQCSPMRLDQSSPGRVCAGQNSSVRVR